LGQALEQGVVIAHELGSPLSVFLSADTLVQSETDFADESDGSLNSVIINVGIIRRVNAQQAREDLVHDHVSHNQTFEQFTHKFNVAEQLVLLLQLALLAIFLLLVDFLFFGQGCSQQSLERLTAVLEQVLAEGALADVRLGRFHAFHKQLKTYDLRAEFRVEACIGVLSLGLAENCLNDNKLFFLIDHEGLSLGIVSGLVEADTVSEKQVA
jgi:hypothetical protein